MNPKRIYHKCDEAFKKEVVSLVLEQGYLAADAAKTLDIAVSILYKWKIEQTQVSILDSDEKAELSRLRKEVK